MNCRCGELIGRNIPSSEEVNVLSISELEALITAMNDGPCERFSDSEFKRVFWKAVDRKACLISDQAIRKRQRNELIELSRRYKHNKNALATLRRSTKAQHQRQRAEFQAAREERRRADGC